MDSLSTYGTTSLKIGFICPFMRVQTCTDSFWSTIFVPTCAQSSLLKLKYMKNMNENLPKSVRKVDPVRGTSRGMQHFNQMRKTIVPSGRQIPMEDVSVEV